MLDKHLIAKTTPKALAENIYCESNYRITVLTDSLIRIEKNEFKEFCDEATQCVINRAFSKNDFEINKNNSEILVKTDKILLTLKEDLMESTVTFLDGRVVKLSEEENLLGTYRTLDACEADEFLSYNTKEEKRTKIQLEKGVVSKNGLAVFDDSKSLIITEDGLIKNRSIEETDIYVFAFDKEYREAIKALYELTGHVSLIPRYALGNWWSRYHAYTQDEYIELMESFKEDNIPFTVATVDMDWHPSTNMPEGIDGWTGYTWNEELFPDYKEFLTDLHKMGLHTTLNLHPASGVQSHECQYEEMARVMGIDSNTGKKVDFDITDDNFINAYFSILHKPYEKDGVDFWWIDWQQGFNTKIPGLDPLWALNHYHFLDIAKEKDGLILSRYCGIGSHRYPVGFSGDTVVTWKTLAYLPYFTANATNAGYTWWSHDIGGHMWGIKDNELYVRFLQFGVFSPINRLHSSNSNAFSKMPDMYPGGTGEIAKKYLRLRHALIPYIYSAMIDNVRSGLGLIEPMYYEYPDCDEAYEFKNQYLFGRQLLVAPITEKSKDKGISCVEVWLPEGVWTDIFTGASYKGNQVIKLYRYLDDIPVFAKKGAIIPLSYDDKNNSIELPKKLKVDLYNGDGEFILHENVADRIIDTKFTITKNSNEYVVTSKKEDAFKDLSDREYVFEFKNMTDADILEANVDFKCIKKDHRNSYTRFTFSGLRDLDKLSFTIKDNTKKEIDNKEILLKYVSMIEENNSVKDELYDNIFSAKTTENVKEAILKADINELYKKQLLEIVQ